MTPLVRALVASSSAAIVTGVALVACKSPPPTDANGAVSAEVSVDRDRDAADCKGIDHKDGCKGSDGCKGKSVCKGKGGCKAEDPACKPRPGAPCAKSTPSACPPNDPLCTEAQQ